MKLYIFFMVGQITQHLLHASSFLPLPFVSPLRKGSVAMGRSESERRNTKDVFSEKPCNCTCHTPLGNNKNISSHTTEVCSPEPPKNLSLEVGDVQGFGFVPGITIGIPLIILSQIFTHHHYHETILTPKIVILLGLVGAYTYGMDKIRDAIADKKNVSNLSSIRNMAKTQYILENQPILMNIYNSFYVIFVLGLFEQDGNLHHAYSFLFLYQISKMLYNIKQSFFFYYLGIYFHTFSVLYVLFVSFMYQTHFYYHECLFLPFLILFDSTDFYLQLKPKMGILKPLYVSAMWVSAFFILPSVIHDQGYDIIALQNWRDFLAPFMLMVGTSNLLDIKDIEADRQQRIFTIPATYGKNNAILFSLFCFVLFEGLFYI